MTTTVRTRFAPSPTGDLHLGSVRTALFAWLYARHFGGQFILRIEDTDQERSTLASEKAILESMAWLGLDHDEGPFYQMKRLERYHEIAQQLLEKKHAYRCYCSKDRLDKLRKAQIEAKEKPRYDGHCYSLQEQDPSQPHVVRLRNPQDGHVDVSDHVYGDIRIANAELDDLVIVRTDGIPTYHFSVVVDDIDMQITHVIRGDDHLNNTARQINIYNALDATPPTYAHVPSVLGPDGARLSKRHGAKSILGYRDEGCLPETLLNYLVRLGWSHGDQEIFSLQESIEAFDGQHISKSPTTFNPEKMQWLNQHYIKTLPTDILVKHLTPLAETLQLDLTRGPALEAVIDPLRTRAKTLIDLLEGARFFYEDVTYDPKARQKFLNDDTRPILQYLIEAFEALDTWEAAPLHAIIVRAGEHFDLKLGKIAQPIRVALTGNTVSPPIDVTLQLMGKTVSLQRLRSPGCQ